MVFYVLVAGIAAVVTFTVALLIFRLSHKYRLYPKIRARDVHTRPTPRLGGIAMFVGVIAAFAVASKLPAFELVFSDSGKILGVLGAALLTVVIGVIDDLIDLDWVTKLAGQVISAALLAWQGAQLASLPVPGGLLIGSPFLSLAATIFICMLVMNAVNFIDGLDGLVAGVAIIASGVFFIYTYVLSVGPTQTEYFNLASFLAVTVIGVCVGFLPLNWRPAKLFMGDAGALLVGLLMAASTIAATGQLDPGNVTVQVPTPDSGVVLGGSGLLPAFIPILLPFAVLIVPLMDFALAVTRRLRAGKSPFSADRKHLHHRLLDMGHSHLHAVLIFYGWTLAASVGCLLFLFVDWWWALIVTALGFLVCAIITLSPLSRRKAVEVAVQSAKPDAQLAQFDPLDSAAVDDDDPTDAAAAAALRRVATGGIPLPGRSGRTPRQEP
ncbi:undecaprenyl/decaprenyl-phosphate alpha-N-acetylglucosaminyl 1-phosphate transferase [Schumannella soli]|uniref:Undecaprenyl/decaprenyl-phosphate alpha-N-acetylglucosaminyl 1-phosphate transferase n=1 Tax=Schumannella soli TaxID=2590779 RepID=A0A506Y6G9_9MICO|nr:MraY family glycosyltransferase [Schumannella soli]TPW76608.1 undecaprenyl/decaprenyl-phosphate alpha-N-acetylglucosaminyl 1-phosphate transferase [Schumannella soli]